MSSRIAFGVPFESALRSSTRMSPSDVDTNGLSGLKMSFWCFRLGCEALGQHPSRHGGQARVEGTQDLGQPV